MPAVWPSPHLRRKRTFRSKMPTLKRRFAGADLMPFALRFARQLSLRLLRRLRSAEKWDGRSLYYPAPYLSFFPHNDFPLQFRKEARLQKPTQKPIRLPRNTKPVIRPIRVRRSRLRGAHRSRITASLPYPQPGHRSGATKKWFTMQSGRSGMRTWLTRPIWSQSARHAFRSGLTKMGG